ncbi:hypothetical protein MSG28_013212 [Choristoneura fumiferana]|uniref:Uncharacterized protein n=1 Tax=Choristoneura fumiferana TaxID=7141 RepID=A0ACC0KSH3_CHOFU|nr:hypothetical protein MSG28_013212 [Choristoneura fumiferana]
MSNPDHSSGHRVSRSDPWRSSVHYFSVSVNETESSTIESPPTLVTGTVQSVQEGSRFLYKPELYLIAKKELSQESSADGIDHNFLHMHVHEIQQNGKVVRTAVTLNKRRLAASSTRNPEKIYIPDLPLSVPESSAADTDNSMYGYACGTCAAIFRSEKEFDVHKVTHQMDEEKPIIDTEQSKLNKNSILVLADPYHKGKTYCCMQCNAKFQRLNNCQRHVKSHILPTEAGIKQAFKYLSTVSTNAATACAFILLKFPPTACCFTAFIESKAPEFQLFTSSKSVLQIFDSNLSPLKCDMSISLKK